MKKISVKFAIKNPRKDGYCLIMARVYFKRNETRHSTGLYIKKEYWDEGEKIPITVLADELKLAVKLNPDNKKHRDSVLREINKAQNLNSTFISEMKAISTGLKEIELHIISIYDNLPDIDKYNKVAVKKAIDSELHPHISTKESPIEFYECYEMFIEQGKKQKSIRTTRKLETNLKKIKHFEKKVKYPISFETINMSFHGKFIDYLIDLGHIDDTIGKEITNLKNFVNWAYNAGYHRNETYKLKAFKATKTARVQNVVLSPEEIEVLADLDLSAKKMQRLDKVRDVFLFAYYTAQRYSDILSFDPRDIKDGFWHIHQEKTRKTVAVPLSSMPEAIYILEKYNNKLPKISDQNFNVYLKEVGQQAGFNREEIIIRYRGNKKVKIKKPLYEHMSSHMARRSRITNLLNAGMPPTTLMIMTGHSDLATLMKYVNTKEKDLKNALDTLQDK